VVERKIREDSHSAGMAKEEGSMTRVGFVMVKHRIQQNMKKKRLL
jgi:hypothetical protein